VLFAFVVLGLVSSVTTSRDWLGRTSPKWPILCWVGHKTWTQAISQPYPKVLVAISKGMQAVKLFSSKIFEFLIVGAG